MRFKQKQGHQAVTTALYQIDLKLFESMKIPNTSMLRTLIALAVVFVVNAQNHQQNGANGMHVERMTFKGQDGKSMNIDLPNYIPNSLLDSPTIRLMIRYNNMAQRTTEGDSKIPMCMRKNTMNSLRLFMMGITPECDENGDLHPKQCYDHSPQCVCVRKDGSMINKPSTTTKGCHCLARKDEEERSGLIGGYVPQCEGDGTYMKKQCHYSTGYCYCVDPMTGKNSTVPARMNPDVDCDFPSEKDSKAH